MKLAGSTLFAAFSAGLFHASSCAPVGKTSVRATSHIRGSSIVVPSSLQENSNKNKNNARVLQSVNKEPTEEEVRSWFGLWDEALATGNSSAVAEMYGEGGTLLPTLSDEVRTDFEGIKDYFDKFLVNEPRGEIIEGHIETGEDWATDIGIYEFTFNTGDVVQGRYSYVYEPQEDGTWKILHHHSSLMPEQQVGHPITEKEVQDLFELWNDALKTGDPKEVAARYSKNGVLLPTLSDDTRTDAAGIEDYFVKFLQHEPTGEIIESNVLIGHDWAQDVGVYEFTFGTTGEKARGRYSYIYVYEDGEWKISHHHSSLMPESSHATYNVTEQDVRDLFTLWNNALQTGDPDTVARRYTKDAVLLPTVSDVPRDTHELIEDYFVKFLKGDPSGEIIESFVHIGHDWLSDVGIYEFTMGTDGSKVRGRYSYLYSMEDGEWKILHHHSSMMPEPLLNQVVDDSSSSHDHHSSHDHSSHDGSSIQDLACNDSDFSTLCSIIEACDDSFAAIEGPYTVFAPNDAAFAELDAAVNGLDTLDADTICDILSFHVVSGQAIHSDDLSCESGEASLIEMSNGSDARVKCSKGLPYGIKGGGNAEPANFIDIDIEASDGVVHAIDNVLFYPSLLNADASMNAIPSVRADPLP